MEHQKNKQAPEQPFYQSLPSAPAVVATGDAIHKADQTNTVVARVPKLRLLAAALIVLPFTGPFFVYLTASLNKLYNNTDQSVLSQLWEILGPLVILQVAASLILAVLLLTSKSTGVVKTVLLIVGLVVALGTLRDLISFSIIGLVIDGFILWWIYQLHETVDALDVRVL